MLLRVGRMPLESNLHARITGMDRTKYAFIYFNYLLLDEAEVS